MQTLLIYLLEMSTGSTYFTLSYSLNIAYPTSVTHMDARRVNLNASKYPSLIEQASTITCVLNFNIVMHLASFWVCVWWAKAKTNPCLLSFSFLCHHHQLLSIAFCLTSSITITSRNRSSSTIAQVRQGERADELIDL